MSNRRLTRIVRMICFALIVRGSLERALVAEARAADLKRSVPWTGSKITGTPEPPPPYTVEPAFPHLKFAFPIALVPAKGTNRLFVGELKGRIVSFRNDPSCKNDRPGVRLHQTAPRPDSVLRPDLSSEFRQKSVCLRLLCPEERPRRWLGRFPVRGEPDRSSRGRSASEQVLLKFWSGGHNGGCLDFGKDGYLYISTGDGAIPSPPDIMNTGQDCSDLLSSVLRIDVDHSDPGRTYRIPADNPFLNSPTSGPRSGPSAFATRGG